MPIGSTRPTPRRCFRWSVRSTPKERSYEAQLVQSAALQSRPFSVFIDYLNRIESSDPTRDPFTFDMDADELIVLNDDPAVMLDALIEMALYMKGFLTLLGVEQTWKIQVAIGAWRHVRRGMRAGLGLPVTPERAWAAQVNPESVSVYDEDTFTQIVALAGCPDVDVVFPPGTAPELVNAYQHLSRIIALVADSITVADHVEFNQRLLRAVSLIEEKIAPPSQP